MPFDAHSNFAYSTVTTAPVPPDSGGSLVVAVGGGALFPAVPFNAVVWPVGTLPLPSTAEVVRVTAIAGDTLTITRTQEGSSARTIVAGDAIADVITAKTLTDIEGKFPIVNADVDAAAAIAASKFAAYPADVTRVLAGDGSWPLGRPAKLFDSTLGADTASIDTGAGGIAGGYDVLIGYLITRTDDAGVLVSTTLTFNNDTGAKYDRNTVQCVNGVVSGNDQVAQTGIVVESRGSGGLAGAVAITRFSIPWYDGTSWHKAVEATTANPDSAVATQRTVAAGWNYRDTAAISRLKLAAVGAAKLKAGSRVMLFGH